MRSKVYLGVILGLFLLFSGCKESRSHRGMQCARCGCSRHTETKGGVTVLDDIYQDDLSKWLSDFRSEPCTHAWVSVSGGSSSGKYWDGISHWDTCLRYIKELHPTVDESVTRQLLKRYYAILEMAHDLEKEERLGAISSDPEVYAKLKELTEEVKTRLKP